MVKELNLPATILIDDVVKSLELLSDYRYQKSTILSANQGFSYSFGKNIERIYFYTGLIEALDKNEIVFSQEADRSLKELKILCDDLADDWNLEDINLFDSSDMNIIREKAKSCLKLIDISDGSESTVKYKNSGDEGLDAQEETKSDDLPYPFDKIVTIPEHICLLEEFINKQIDAKQFIGNFNCLLCMYDEFELTDDIKDSLHPIYDGIENFTTEPPVREYFSEDINEEQLHAIVEKTYLTIKELNAADKIYKKKSIVLKKLLLIFSITIFNLPMFAFFLFYSLFSFSELTGSLLQFKGLLPTLNVLILLCTFSILCVHFRECLRISDFEIQEIKRLFRSLIFKKPNIETLSDRP